ncbi:hypothetical protein CRENPOLYSF1_300002 [Crenothrix polyspora]|uniref:Uncharacterized protein n=1 Tax=Crenothrix polyspora TaxID=360316 RepID=A0A1R4H916_9GAMM|nr:hypothetical protein CRENPOLYSF1_300002 [Crenothrix polyspora]
MSEAVKEALTVIQHNGFEKMLGYFITNPAYTDISQLILIKNTVNRSL